MNRPTPRTLKAFAAMTPLALLVVFVPAVWPLWAISIMALLVACIADWALSIPRSKLDIDFRIPPVAYLGEPLQATVSVPNLPTHARLDLAVDVSGPATMDALHVCVARDSDTWPLTVHLSRRGRFKVDQITLAWTGPLGLMSTVASIPRQDECAVVPNVAAVQRAALRLSTHHTFMTGVKTRRMLGDGSEFEALRQYLPGLDHRMIDWKSSAKHRKLLWREHRSERNHRVVLAIDSGRLMSEPIDGLPRLDHAINAGMLLAYLALRSGDQVGLLGFDSEVRLFVSPTRGVASLHGLMTRAAEIDYSNRESNFTLGLSELGRRRVRRSVVVVLTDFVDPTSAELMVENLHHLAQKHLVIFLSIRDATLTDVVRSRPTDVTTINRAVVAYDLEQDREQVLQSLRRRGIHCIDATPEDATVRLLNKYLDVQRRELV